MQDELPIRILLVEDNPGDARLLREALADVTTVPFVLVHVDRLGEALLRLEQEPFDGVLLDLSLPDSQGVNTFFNVHVPHMNLPVIVLTSLADETFAVAMIGSGAQDYLIKGQFDGHTVMRAMRYAIDRQAGQRALRLLSLTDDLTELHNRRGFFERATQQIKLAHRHHTTLLVLYADIDGLKRVNDTLGHAVGSQLLIDAAHILRATFRETDIISRFGGDEFVILGIDAVSHDQAVVVSRLQAHIIDYNAHGQHPYELSISLGIVPFDPHDALTLEAAITCADQAMYLQKQNRSLARGA